MIRGSNQRAANPLRTCGKSLPYDSADRGPGVRVDYYRAEKHEFDKTQRKRKAAPEGEKPALQILPSQANIVFEEAVELIGRKKIRCLGLKCDRTVADEGNGPS
jgi:hypothetical protein